jgi:hypothetical protein
MREWLLSQEELLDSVTNHDSGFSVGFTVGRLKDSLKRKGKAQRLAYGGLRDLLENAAFVAHEPSDREHLQGQDVYFVPMQIGDRFYSVKIKVDVEKVTTLSAYKDHKAVNIDVTPAVNKAQAGNQPIIGYPQGGPTRSSAAFKIGDLMGDYKPEASKVLDENGEPLVVYHGTMEDFTEFNTKAKAHLGKLDTKLGSHFARSPKISDTFAGGAYAVASDYYVDAYTPENSWYRDRSGQIRFDGLFGYRGGWNDPIVPYDPAEHGEFRNLAHEGRIVMLRPNGTVLPVFLNIKKPIDAMSQDKDAWDETEVEKAVAQAILPTHPEIFREYILPNVLDGEAVLAQLQAGQTPITQGKYSYPDIGAFVADYHAMNYVPAEVVKAALRDAGFDGVIYNNTSKQEINNTDQSQRQSYIIFEPEQAKSATGNTGEFNPENPDIRYSRPDDRLARARSMGFDTSQVWYHGSPVGNDIRAFDLGKVGAKTGTREKAIFLTDTPDVAAAYAYQDEITMEGDTVTAEESYGALYPVYIRGRLYDATAEVEGKRYNSRVFQAITEKAEAAGYAGVDFGRNLGGPMERHRLSGLECVPAQKPRKAVLPTAS